MKSHHRVIRKNKLDTCGTPVFAPDYSATVLAAKMFTNSNDHSMYFRFIWCQAAQGGQGKHIDRCCIQCFCQQTLPIYTSI